MATKTIDLDFIPVNLEGNPLMSTTLAKVVGKLLCESTRDTDDLKRSRHNYSVYHQWNNDR
jgi:hypothetical protein